MAGTSVSWRNSSKLLGFINKRLSRALCTSVANYPSTESSTKIAEHLVQLETATKRKDILHHRRKILRTIRTDPLVERAALDKELKIPLETVNNDWAKTRGLREVAFLAKYYGIFKHVFKGKEFKPKVWLNVNFENTGVHRGNIIEPSECLNKPIVSFDETSDKYHSLLLVNPDGCYPVADAEILHWMVINAPGNQIKNGKELSYIPPLPWKGTGFHRFCLAVFAHDEPVDLAKINESSNNRLKFQTAEFLEKTVPSWRPVGLSWFQAQWDLSVSESAKQLGISEPIFEWEEYISPKQLSNIVRQKRINNKYRIKFTDDDILLGNK